jgi:hypothetical protein
MLRLIPGTLAALLVLAACNQPAATIKPEVSSMTFTLSSSAFAEGGAIPSHHTCEGDDASPPLRWADPPDGTAAFALIVDDPDANGWVHWLIYDIPGNATALAEDASRAAGAAPQGRTTWGTTGYRGPCPPSGSHRYVFRLLALRAPLGLAAGAEVEAVQRAAAGVRLGEAVLTGTYRKR